MTRNKDGADRGNPLQHRSSLLQQQDHIRPGGSGWRHLSYSLADASIIFDLGSLAPLPCNHLRMYPRNPFPLVQLQPSRLSLRQGSPHSSAKIDDYDHSWASGDSVHDFLLFEKNLIIYSKRHVPLPVHFLLLHQDYKKLWFNMKITYYWINRTTELMYYLIFIK